MNIKRRIFAGLLAFLLVCSNVFSALPMEVYAAEETELTNDVTQQALDNLGGVTRLMRKSPRK